MTRAVPQTESEIAAALAGEEFRNSMQRAEELTINVLCDLGDSDARIAATRSSWQPIIEAAVRKYFLTGGETVH
jgi:hypothetical protein